MFDDFPKSTFEIVGPQGESRGTTQAIHTRDQIIVLDTHLIIQTGDEMRRALPNGTDETFEVTDPHYQEETFGIPAHFQVEVRRKGVFPHNAGGHFNISVSGANARVNIGSTDHSTNSVHDSSVFADLRSAITNNVTDDEQQRQLMAAIEQMEAKRGGPDFVGAYQKFIGLAADHIGVIGPLLPALTGFLA